MWVLNVLVVNLLYGRDFLGNWQWSSWSIHKLTFIEPWKFIIVYTTVQKWTGSRVSWIQPTFSHTHLRLDLANSLFPSDYNLVRISNSPSLHALCKGRTAVQAQLLLICSRKCCYVRFAPNASAETQPVLPPLTAFIGQAIWSRHNAAFTQQC